MHFLDHVFDLHLPFDLLAIRMRRLLDAQMRPFVIVLVETAGQHDPPLGPFGHLGVACASREEIDRLVAEASREGRPTRAPFDAGEPIGYVARIADPDGNSLELSFGQEVGLAVETSANAPS